MPTSGSYDYKATASAIIAEAYRKVGALGDTEALDATRQAIGMVMLNMMVKTFSAFGLQMWLRDEQFIPLSLFNPDQAITVGPGQEFNLIYKPLRLLECQRYDLTDPADPISIPVQNMTEREYQQQNRKRSEGAPVQVFYRPDAYIGWIHVWPNADTYWRTNGSLGCIFHRPVQDFDTVSDDPDFPSEWHEALVYQLAVRLAPNVGLPPNDRDRLQKDADKILGLVLSHDQEEGSIYFRPEQRR
jgi:hypothetical protein